MSFHRFPSDVNRRRVWLSVYDLTEDQYKPYWRICSRHFPGGDTRLAPVIQRGKRAASHSTQPTRETPPALIATAAEPLGHAHSLMREPSQPEPAPMEDRDVAIALSREATQSDPSSGSLGVVLHTALLTHAKALDAENQMLKQQVCITQDVQCVYTYQISKK